MNAEDMWGDYKKSHPEIETHFRAWQFGALPDQLADLVSKGIKTATASAYDLYAHYNEELPDTKGYDIILDSKDQAVCIIKNKEVKIVPFKEVSAEHAYKEGEGDRSLAYWRQIHEEFFEEWLKEAGLSFSEDSLVVLEEFEKVYPK